MDELLAAFQEWMTETGPPSPVTGEPTNECALRLEGNDKGVRLTVPDDTDEEAIESVILAHDPEALSKGEQLVAERDTDDKDLADRYTTAVVFLTNAIDNWPGMTGAQKQTWLVDHFDEVLKVERALLKFAKWSLRNEPS